MGPVCTFFQHFLESFSQLEHAVDSALQLLSFSDILYFTGDGSGMSICNFSYCSWLEIDPSTSEQFWLNEQFGPNAERCFIGRARESIRYYVLGGWVGSSWPRWPFWRSS